MRLRGRWAPLAAGLVVLGMAGCGSSAPKTKPTVNVTITAPTSGATVGVHRVLVAGTVTPANAQVMVGGRPAQVSNGRFTRQLYLATPSQVVTVTAQAQGYVGAQTATTVHYSPNLAAQLVASASALTAQPAAVPVSSTPAAKASAKSVSALNQALALPSNAGSPVTGNGSGSATKHKTSKPKPSTSTTPTGTTPTPTPTPAPAPSSSGGGSTQPVTTPPVTTVARIKQAWNTGCLTHVKGENVVPYCTCLYNHLSATGTFKTTAAVNGLLKKLRNYSKTGDPTTLPRAVQRALTVCAVKLPALTSTGTQPTVTRLPGLSHQRVPFPVIAKLPSKTAR